ncbi:MAG: hypothetical protein ACREH6_13795 [Geminicoccaceae bacterium]
MSARHQLLKNKLLHVTAGRGTILPMDGRDHGHKGYGLALAIEALTQGLSGYGRADARPPGAPRYSSR